jgi:hypothetical protein
VKVRTFLVVFVAGLVAVTIILASVPIVELDYFTRTGGMPQPGPGTYFDYVFEDFYTTYGPHVPATEEYSYFSGVLAVTESGGALRMNEWISPSEGTTRFISYELGSSSSFAESLLNGWALSNGAIERVDGQVSSTGTASQPYVVLYAGELPSNVTEDASFIGQTIPFQLTPLDPNETGVEPTAGSGLGPLQFSYDTAGGSNILVGTVFSGNASFVTDLFPGFGIASVTGLVVNLVGTNVDLGPLDLTHYLTENILATLVLWAIGLVLLFLILRRARIRIRAVAKKSGPRTHAERGKTPRTPPEESRRNVTG